MLIGQDKTLLVGKDVFLDTKLGVEVIALVHFVLDGLASECPDEDLHASTETVQARCLLNVVVRDCAAARKLLTGQDKTLLVGKQVFLNTKRGLEIIALVHFVLDSLASECLDEDLHATMETV